MQVQKVPIQIESMLPREQGEMDVIKMKLIIVLVGSGAEINKMIIVILQFQPLMEKWQKNCAWGGCIYYHIKEASKITDTWILNHVVPLINDKFGSDVAIPLGRALLFCILDPIEQKHVHPSIVNRVLNAYTVPLRDSELTAEENAIAQVPLIVGNNAGTLILEPFYIEDHLTPNADGVPRRIYEEDAVAAEVRRRRNDNENLLRLQSMIIADRKTQVEFKMEMKRMHDILCSEMMILRKQMVSLMRRPVNNGFRNRGTVPPIAVNAGVPSEIQNLLAADNIRTRESHARLSYRPKHLEDLWQEWEFGVGGRKAAKLFTSSERGLKENKFAYSRRKPFWLLMHELIRRGHGTDSACQLIRKVYGESIAVGKILEQIRKDKGNNPRLLQLDAN